MRLFLLIMLSLLFWDATAAPRLIAPAPLVPGFAPAIRMEGLGKDDRVRVWTVRHFARWQEVEGKWVEVPVALYAWADFAPVGGRVDTQTMASLAGTYQGIDPYGGFWSGRTRDDPLIANAKPPVAEKVAGAAAQIVAVVDGQEMGRASMAWREPQGLRVATMQQGGIAGVYVAPADGRRHPVMLLLHGSEGGNADGARELAMRYAAQGYAAFAVMYFAFDLAKVEGVSYQHINTPIEVLAVARDWVAGQPEADATRLGVYGHSKGAEFAEVAAVRYPWIRAVVACVPTDVVWEGYGHNDERNRPEHRGLAPAEVSSWSWQGKPLPYVRLRPFNWREPSQYFNNTERYERSRQDDPKRATDAVIAIEESRARFLLLGGEKDEVWASGTMARALAKRFEKLPATRRPEVHVFEGAGHGICGDGTYPPRVHETTTPDPRSKDLDKEGAAAARAWELTVDFLRRSLGGRPVPPVQTTPAPSP